MAHQGRVNARSTSMQSREGDSGVRRICHSRFDGTSPEAAHAFVMQQLNALSEGCVLEIELGFNPLDFLDELAEHVAYAQVQKLSRHRWMLLLQRPGQCALMDLRDLEAPLPMEQILEAAADLRPGETLIARTPCFPRPLLAQLDRRELDWEAAEAADASGLIWLRRPN
jgi:uncharacterized protein (DUF2249 family)